MEFYSAKEVKARKQHFCSFCGRKTKAGEHLLSERGKYDGDFFRRYACPECQPLLSDFWEFCDNECSRLPDDFTDWVISENIDHPAMREYRNE